MISTSGQEQQKKKDMAELLSEVVARNGNDSANGGKILSPFNFSVSDWLKSSSFNILHNQPALTNFGRRFRYPVNDVNGTEYCQKKGRHLKMIIYKLN